MAEQQVQRYEASPYSGASFARLCDVAAALQATSARPSHCAQVIGAVGRRVEPFVGPLRYVVIGTARSVIRGCSRRRSASRGSRATAAIVAFRSAA